MLYILALSLSLSLSFILALSHSCRTCGRNLVTFAAAKQSIYITTHLPMYLSIYRYLAIIHPPLLTVVGVGQAWCERGPDGRPRRQRHQMEQRGQPVLLVKFKGIFFTNLGIGIQDWWEGGGREGGSSPPPTPYYGILFLLILHRCNFFLKEGLHFSRAPTTHGYLKNPQKKVLIL